MMEIVDAKNQVLGTISWTMCSLVEDLEKSSLCQPSFVPHLICQIPDFEYPVVVLNDINIGPQRNGHGTAALRLFHQSTSQQGARFALLRVAPQGDDCESGIRWRQNFYAREGWIRLVRPDIEHLFWEWMFRPLDPSLDTLSETHVHFKEPEPRQQPIDGIISLFGDIDIAIQGRPVSDDESF